jgi:hypothetical protein
MATMAVETRFRVHDFAVGGALVGSMLRGLLTVSLFHKDRWIHSEQLPECRTLCACQELQGLGVNRAARESMSATEILRQ